jgi:hypothetical protein
LRICNQLGSVLESGQFKELAGLLLISHLGFNLTPQRVIARTAFVKQCCAFIAASLERGLS